mgnify:CR=1
MNAALSHGWIEVLVKCSSLIAADVLIVPASTQTMATVCPQFPPRYRVN